MLNWIKKIVINKYVAATIRHALGAMSGYLIAIGVSEDVSLDFTKQLADIAVNSLPAITALIWSYIEKKKA